MSPEPCRSYRPGHQLCDDGFPIKPICSGRYGCVMCGAISEASIPLCMKEDADLPPHLFTEDGRPRHVRAALSPTQDKTP